MIHKKKNYTDIIYTIVYYNVYPHIINSGYRLDQSTTDYIE